MQRYGDFRKSATILPNFKRTCCDRQGKLRQIVFMRLSFVVKGLKNISRHCAVTFSPEAVTFSREAVTFFCKAVKFFCKAVTFYLSLLTSHFSLLTMDSLTEKHPSLVAHVAPCPSFAGFARQEVRGGMGDVGGVFLAYNNHNRGKRPLMKHF